MGIGTERHEEGRTRRCPSGMLRGGWALAAALLLGAGCIMGPAQPSSGDKAGWALSPPVQDPLVLTADGGTADFETVPTDSAIDLAVDAMIAVEGTGTLPDAGLSVSAEIDGAKGGSLHAGRFILTVPRGAFDGTATVTCRLPDSTMMLCDLQISAETPDQFKVPVVLSLDTRDLGVDDSTLSIFWYDPSVTGWRAMPTTVDSKESVVSVALTHFSRYCGGKAGW